jgi:hypothetical protein
MKKIIIGCFIIVFLALIIIFNRQQGVFMGESIVVPSVTPTQSPPAVVEASSIEGKMKLIMRTIPKEDGLFSYTFFVFDGEREYSIFTKDAKKNAFVVPSNSWSPDGSFVFIIDTSSLHEQVLVFNASGETFGEEEKYLNVTELFTSSNQQQIFDTATGWDSRGLLHLRTQNPDGTKGPSYWFDVDSRTFIQLAAR